MTKGTKQRKDLCLEYVCETGHYYDQELRNTEVTSPRPFRGVLGGMHPSRKRKKNEDYSINLCILMYSWHFCHNISIVCQIISAEGNLPAKCSSNTWTAMSVGSSDSAAACPSGRGYHFKGDILLKMHFACSLYGFGKLKCYSGAGGKLHKYGSPSD